MKSLSLILFSVYGLICCNALGAMPDGRSLDEIVLTGNCRLIRAALASSSQVNKPDRDLKTALHKAVLMNRPDIVALLLKHSAIITWDVFGNTPVDLAQQMHHSYSCHTSQSLRRQNNEMILELLTPLLKSPLQWSLQRLDFAAVERELQENWGYIRAFDYLFETPLHTLAHLSYRWNEANTITFLRIANALIDLDVALDQQNVVGNTALHIAARFGNFDLAMLLISRGARKNIINREGNSPLEIALEHHNKKELVRILV